MGKMIQLTHRLVGLLQVLEWSWKIAEEYIQMNYCFSGSVTEDFILDIRNIFNKFHTTNDVKERAFVSTVTSVEHAINISEALLEQYKLLMRLPDEVIRVTGANKNNIKDGITEHKISGEKLEKSKSKRAEHISRILLFNSVMFTSTTLYDSHNVFKHYSQNVNMVLQDLTKIGLLKEFQDGTISRTKKAVVYVKWIPYENDPIECQQFELMLATFNDSTICAKTVIDATTTASLLPHKARPKPIVLNYLNSDRYARLNLKLNEAIIAVGRENSILKRYYYDLKRNM